MNINRVFDRKRKEPRIKPRHFEHEKSPELRPCPLCGGKGIECRNDGKYRVMCDVKNCRYSPGAYSTREKAIEAWNRI